jgi:hypothetical protein
MEIFARVTKVYSPASSDKVKLRRGEKEIEGMERERENRGYRRGREEREESALKRQSKLNLFLLL